MFCNERVKPRAKGRRETRTPKEPKETYNGEGGGKGHLEGQEARRKEPRTPQKPEEPHKGGKRSEAPTHKDPN